MLPKSAKAGNTYAYPKLCSGQSIILLTLTMRIFRNLSDVCLSKGCCRHKIFPSDPDRRPSAHWATFYYTQWRVCSLAAPGFITNYTRPLPVSNDLYILEFFFIICTIFGSRLMGCRAEALLLTMMTATVGKEKEAKQSSKAQATCGGCG